MVIDRPTQTPPELREMPLREALETERAKDVEAAKDARDALAHRQAKAEQLETKLAEMTHASFSHALVPAQRAIRALQTFRDRLPIDGLEALKMMTVRGQVPEDVLAALSSELLRPIFDALSACREIEAAHGQAGWCTHQKKTDAPNGWTATPAGTVARLRVVKP